jgi:hypothetical protein
MNSAMMGSQGKPAPTAQAVGEDAPNEMCWPIEDPVDLRSVHE